MIQEHVRRVQSWYNLTGPKIACLLVFIFIFVVTMFFVNVSANISSFWSPMKAYNHSLQDTGCDFFNNGYQSESNYNNVVDIIMICFLAISIFFILINRLAVFIALKLLGCLSLTYLLRCITLMFTALPDSWDLGIRTICNTFSEMSRDRGGDLIFSGHTLLVCTFAHCWSSFYIISDSFAFHVISAICAWIVAVTIFVFIVVGRLHYTIDVLLGIYIASGVWWSSDYFLTRYFELPVCKLKFREERIPAMISSSCDDTAVDVEQPVGVEHV
ncbi:hypothetical protein NEMIN01_1551 [Nematocida minor]|uniref:uncharacterized protein n=1 Tax=Nematocida minor TaxID=1912983 RepID=UPI0022201F55|nr:uncharacterized protein NEMIN01_1551 [Nematocida minor]KAI5191525.1 hypothetical protein NEMIN01_1551 [Nematocida minor]